MNPKLTQINPLSSALSVTTFHYIVDKTKICNVSAGKTNLPLKILMLISTSLLSFIQLLIFTVCNSKC